MVRQLAAHGFVGESYRELEPMLDRVLKHGGFFEWWTPDNEPRGSGKFRGSAGVLIEAIHELRAWARSQPAEPAPEPPDRGAADPRRPRVPDAE